MYHYLSFNNIPSSRFADNTRMQIYMHLGAVLWVLAYFIYCRVQYPTTPTLQDFADFMRRVR